jgi:diguanylate cyclase (GGDEF)-like protein/PAS domain S-box-containing protein
MTQDKRECEYTLRRYQAVLASQIYGIALVGEDGRFELVNQVLCDIFDVSISPANLVGLITEDIYKLMAQACADPEGSIVRIRSVLAAGRHRIGDEVLMADGRVLLADFIPIVIDGRPSGRMWQFRDITERKQTEALLAAEKKRLANILESSNVGTWEWNVQTGETIFDERWAEIIGYKLEALAPVSIDTWFKLTHPDDLEMMRSLLEKHFRKELPYYTSETRMRHKDGHWIWILDRGKVTAWTDDGKPLIMHGTHRDVTERKLAEEKILHLATHDVLTGLPSLRLIKDRLAMALGLARRHNTRAAVYFLDLDGFKKVNDTFGHDAGDYVLTVIADRLQSCMREIDTVARFDETTPNSGTVARVGGDEFLIISTDLHSSRDAGMIAERAIKSISRDISLNGGSVAVGMSIGIALYPDNGDDIDGLIKLADQAMYKAKNSGGSRYCFAGDLTEK